MEAAATGWIPIAASNGFELRDLLIPAGLSLICLWLIMRYRRRQHRLAQTHRLTADEQVQRAKDYRGVYGDLEKLMVEVEQLAKRFATQLDAKSLQIEDLLRAADLRIQALERLLEQPPPHNNTGPEKPRDPVRTKPPARPDQYHPAKTTSDDLARRICRMADAGMAPVDIARELTEHVGKIELILSLRNAG